MNKNFRIYNFYLLNFIIIILILIFSNIDIFVCGEYKLYPCVGTKFDYLHDGINIQKLVYIHRKNSTSSKLFFPPKNFY
jgi:hypothetical protein